MTEGPFDGCRATPRPCRVPCRYSVPFGDRGCALDHADDGQHTLAEIAELFGFTRERARQLEARGIEKLSRRLPVYGLDASWLAELEETAPAAVRTGPTRVGRTPDPLPMPTGKPRAVPWNPHWMSRRRIG